MTDWRALQSAFAAASLACLMASGAIGQSAPTSPPLPPPRPSFNDDAPRPQGSDPQPDSGATTHSTPKPDAARVTKPADVWVWPPADRQAMRACALEWQRLNEKGAAGATTWRDFAPPCLSRQTQPRK